MLFDPIGSDKKQLNTANKVCIQKKNESTRHHVYIVAATAPATADSVILL